LNEVDGFEPFVIYPKLKLSPALMPPFEINQDGNVITILEPSVD
jgi:hypothetical protein